MYPNQDDEVSINEQGDLTINLNNYTPSGTGNQNIDFTVPAGKKWALKAWTITESGFTGTVSECRLQKIIDTITATYFYTTTTPSQQYYEYKNTLIFKAGDVIRFRVNVSAYTSGILAISLFYSESDA